MMRSTMRVATSGFPWRHLAVSRRLAPLSRHKTTIRSPHDRGQSEESDATTPFNPDELCEQGEAFKFGKALDRAGAAAGSCRESAEAVPPFLTGCRARYSSPLAQP